MTATKHVYSVRLDDGRTFGPVEGPILVQWAKEGRLHAQTWVVSSSGKEARAADIPELRSFVAVPNHGAAKPPPAGDETVATIIPYRNRPALIGYYLSIAGLLPLLGAPCAPTAMVLGVMGHRKWRRDRSVKGVVHAWVAIVLGLIGTAINGLMLFGVFFSLMSR